MFQERFLSLIFSGLTDIANSAEKQNSGSCLKQFLRYFHKMKTISIYTCFGLPKAAT